MAKKKKPMVKREKKVVEMSKGKSREEEEKFYEKFSHTQLNAVLLIILASTFLVQGIMNYLQIMNMTHFLKPWLTWIFISLVFLVTSVLSVVVGGVLFPLKVKREINIFSFATFVLGFVFFLVSLFFLMFIVLIAV